MSAQASDAAKEPQRVVIVGGGVGGLAVASRIASAKPSARVTIVEKNSQVGGRCGSFDRTIEGVGVFRHERGPSLLLLPQVYREVFSDCSSGSSAEEYGLTMLQCVPAYQVVFDDGSKLEVGFPRPPGQARSAPELTSRARMNSYEPDGATKWDEYMRATSAFLECGLPNFIEERLDLLSFPNFLMEALRDYARAWPLKPHSDVLDALFDSDKLKALASFQDLYVGLEPYRNNQLLGGGVLKSTAPAVFGLLAAIELHPHNPKSGVFAPVGGFQSVTNALVRLAKDRGVTVQCDTTVTSVQPDGVHIINEANNNEPQFLPADLVIINADLPYATKSLLQEKPSPPIPTFDWDDRFTFSSGVIAFHWSLQRCCDDLNTHNVFLVAGNRPQAELSWTILRNNQGDVDESTPFNFYVHRATQTDPSAAPVGCDSLLVLVPCRTLLRDEECAKLPRDQAMTKYKQQFSDEVIAKARRAVLQRLAAINSLKDLQQDILDEVVDTPATYADQFHVAAGTPFALSHGFGQLSLTRPGPASSSSKGVLFCGASTRPGNGVPLVLVGAKQVAVKAIAALKKQQQEGKTE